MRARGRPKRRKAVGKGSSRSKIVEENALQNRTSVGHETVKTSDESDEEEDYLTLKRKYEELLKKVEILEKSADLRTQTRSSSSDVGRNKADPTISKEDFCQDYERAEAVIRKRSLPGETTFQRAPQKSKLFNSQERIKQNKAKILKLKRLKALKGKPHRKVSSASQKNGSVSTSWRNKDLRQSHGIRKQQSGLIVPRTSRCNEIQTDLDVHADDNSALGVKTDKLPASRSTEFGENSDSTRIVRRQVNKEAFNFIDASEEVSKDPPILVYLPLSARAPADLLESVKAGKYDYSFRTESRCTIDDLTQGICRVCYRKDEVCCDMFEDRGQLAKLFTTFLPIEELTESDPLPHTVCLDCAGVLQAMDDLAFRCYIAQPFSKSTADNWSQNVAAIIDPIDKSWRTETNARVLRKYSSPLPTLLHRLENQCRVDNMDSVHVETCHICARQDVSCLKISCDDSPIRSAIETFLSIWPPEDGFSSFHACLECLGIVQLMDNLAYRFFNVESCLQQHYKIFKTITLDPYKETQGENTASEIEIDESFSIAKQHSSCMLPMLDELEQYVPQGVESHVSSLDEDIIVHISASEDARLGDSSDVGIPDAPDRWISMEDNDETPLVDSGSAAFNEDDACFDENLPLSEVLDQSNKENKKQPPVRKKHRATKKKIQAAALESHVDISSISPICSLDHNYAQRNGFRPTIHGKKISGKEPSYSQKLKKLKSQIKTSEEADQVPESPHQKSVQGRKIPEKSITGTVSNRDAKSKTIPWNLPKLRFVMKLWVYPSALFNKKGKITSAELTNVGKGTPISLPPKDSANQWIIDFNYEAYYSSVDGVLVPSYFKIFPGDHSELSVQFMLRTVQDQLRIDRLQLMSEQDNDSMKFLDLNLTNAVTNSMSSLILQDSIRCLHCKAVVLKTNLIKHFIEKHTVKCKKCKTFALWHDNLFEHEAEVHGTPYIICDFCGRKLRERTSCEHRLECKLCDKNTRKVETLLKHEDTHFQSISKLQTMFKQLYSVPQKILDKFCSIKQTFEDICSVCGKKEDDYPSAEACNHTFLCNECGELYHNHPLFLRHKCDQADGKPTPIKSPQRPQPQLSLHCAICANFTCVDEHRYQQHFKACYNSLVNNLFLLKSRKANHMISDFDYRLIPVRCQLCGFAASTFVSFCKHYAKCVAQRMIFCDVCSEAVPVQEAEDHVCQPRDSIKNSPIFNVSRSDVISTLTPLFECYICDLVFTSSSFLNMHFTTAHPTNERCCPVCQVVFRSSCAKTLISHVSQHSPPTVKQRTTGNDTETEFNCQVCSTFFKTRCEQIVHDLFHHNRSVFVCSCRERFLSSESMTNHHIISCELRKAWSCPDCSKVFSSFSLLQDHAICHFRATTCHWCKTVFKSRSALGTHLRYAHPEKSFSCTICAKSFLFADTLTRHYQARHSKNIFCCAYCYKAFGTVEALSVHSSDHGLNDCYCHFCTRKRTQPRIQYYSCDVCFKTFDRPLDLYEHDKTQHPKKFQYHCNSCWEVFSCVKPYRCHSVGCAAAAEREESKAGETALCENCGECFSTKEDLRKHYTTHLSSLELSEPAKDSPDPGIDVTPSEVSNMPSGSCPLCNKYFKALNFSIFLRHIRSHDAIQMVEVTIGFSKGLLKCSTEGCPKRFTSKVVERLHEIFHHDKALYQCKVCFTQFDSYSGWKSHENKCSNEFKKEHNIGIESAPTTIETADQMIKCKICSKTFTNRAALVTHTNKVHCDNNPFECEICHKKYSCQDYLNCHKRNVHSGQTYHCEACGKSFTARKYYLVHLKKHKDATTVSEFKCEICEAQLYSSAGFKNHMQAHSKGEGYPCRECTAVFIRKLDLKAHCKVKHSGVGYHLDILAPRTRPVSKKDKYSQVFLNFCRICKVYFNSWNDMRSHCGAAVTNGNFRCEAPDCGISFNDECSLNFHSRYHQDGNQCELCGKIFTYVKVHRLHLQLEHNEIFPLHCEHCHRGFSLKKMMASHNKECNSELLTKDLSIREGCKGGRKVKGTIVACDHCDKVFVNGADLSIHFKVEHKDYIIPDPTSYTCRICGSSHACHLSLINHTRFHYRNQEMPGTYCCPLCGYLDSRLPSMISHQCSADGTSKTHSSTRGFHKTSRSTNVHCKQTKGNRTFRSNKYHESLSNSPASSSLEIDSAVDVIMQDRQIVSPTPDLTENDLTSSTIRNAINAEVIVNTEIEYEITVPDSTTNPITSSTDPNSDIVFLCSFCNSNHENMASLETHLKAAHNLQLEDLAFQLVS